MDTPPQIYTKNDTILLNLVIYSRKNKFIFNNILKKLLSRITNITTLLTNLWALGTNRKRLPRVTPRVPCLPRKVHSHLYVSPYVGYDLTHYKHSRHNFILLTIHKILLSRIKYITTLLTYYITSINLLTLD